MWKKRLDSFKYAFSGIKALFKTQPNAQIEAVLGVLSVFLGIFFQISRAEWMILIGCASLVLSLEAVNTSIENIVDLVSPQSHPLAGRAKDLAAAAVLIAAISALLIGGIIFLPKIFVQFS